MENRNNLYEAFNKVNQMWLVVVSNDEINNGKPYMQFATHYKIAKMIGMQDITDDFICDIFKLNRDGKLDRITYIDNWNHSYVDFYDCEGRLIAQAEYNEH